MIEGDPVRYKDLERTVSEFPEKLHGICSFVSASCVEKKLDTLLRGCDIPSDFDVLSIDIDSFDYCIWESLENYLPKIVVIEINSSLPPGVHKIHGQSGEPGSSFTSTVELGHKKGYHLVCHTGNLIFVRKDLIGRLDLPTSELEDPDSLFIYDWVTDPVDSSARCAKTECRLSLFLKKVFKN